MSRKELDEMIAAEEKRLNLGSEEFMSRHSEIMEEADRIQKREAARKEAGKGMEELKKVLERLNICGHFDTRIYGPIIIVYHNHEYLGTFHMESKEFIDLDVSRAGKERNEKHDKSGDCEPLYGVGTEENGNSSAEQHGQQAGAGSGGKDHSSGDGSAGDGHETANRGREADSGDADDQGGSRAYRVVV